MKKLLSFLLGMVMLVACLGTLSGCFKRKKKVIIYTNCEDYRIEKFQELFDKKFTDVEVILQYYDTGTLAAKVAAEGTDTLADIIWGLDAANATKLSKNFATLTGYDTSIYLDELVDSNNKYHVWSKEAGCVIINTQVFADHGWAVPDSLSFADLLDNKYRNYIAMPNPKSSGTGYFYYNAYVATYGEAAANTYFSSFANQVKEFTTSGSGPVKMADKGEIAIGLGMTFQAVDYVKTNSNLQIMFLNEGSPYSLYTSSIIKGREKDSDVKRVYDYMYNELFKIDKELFNPEIIYKGQEITKEGYPTTISYAQMINLSSYEYKEYLLNKWTYDIR